MTIFLDSNIVIYLIENTTNFGPRALRHYTQYQQAGDVFEVSDLVRLETRVLPVRLGRAALVARYDTFFATSTMRVLPLTVTVCDRATLIRAAYNFKLADSMQLAAAIVHGCDRFLTADARLNRCTDIAVELLP